MTDNILDDLTGGNVPANVVAAIRASKKLMKYLGDEIEAAGSLEGAIANSFDLEWTEKQVTVRDTDGRTLAKLTLENR